MLDTCAKTNTAPFTLLNRLQQTPNPSSYNNPLDALDIAAECLDHMAAGIDTTGDALCFLMWELSQPRSMPYQRALQRELLAAANPTPGRGGGEGGAGGVGFDKLPYLDAVVLEGLRCFPAIPMSLPRYVPGGPGGLGGGGGGDGDGRIIDGVFVPRGTTVSCQAYSVQRLDGGGVFPEPEVFRPERWLAAEGDAERKRRFFAFASGGRGCVGKQYVLFFFLFFFFYMGCNTVCALLGYTHTLLVLCYLV